MIRSARIPSVLRKICTDDVIQTALLVTTDGELLGSTATTFVSPDGTTKESVESLGTLIADIAVDYGKLGEEYANLDPPGSTAASTTSTTTTTTAPAAATSTTAMTSAVTASSSQGGSVVPTTASTGAGTTNLATNVAAATPKSHLQCLFLELELGLVAVATCVGVDCMVIAIAAPSAPMGTIRARLQSITAHIQEQLSPLAIMGSSSAGSSSGRVAAAGSAELVGSGSPTGYR